MPDLLQIAEIFSWDPQTGVAVDVVVLGASGKFVRCDSRWLASVLHPVLIDMMPFIAPPPQFGSRSLLT